MINIKQKKNIFDGLDFKINLEINYEDLIVFS